MIKLLLATILVLLIYSLYRQLKNRAESLPGGRASNKRDKFDSTRAVEAEYQIIEEGEESEDG
jgi:hypothetical protein